MNPIDDAKVETNPEDAKLKDAELDAVNGRPAQVFLDKKNSLVVSKYIGETEKRL
jgi:hypothetical protein